MLGDLQGPIGVLGGGRYLQARRRRGAGRGGGPVLWRRRKPPIATRKWMRSTRMDRNIWTPAGLAARGKKPRNCPRARAGRKSEMRGIKMATPMRTRKYTRAATTDSKSGKLASNFGKLLENEFCMFRQILKDGKSFTKLLEML